VVAGRSPRFRGSFLSRLCSARKVQAFRFTSSGIPGRCSPGILLGPALVDRHVALGKANRRASIPGLLLFLLTLGTWYERKWRRLGYWPIDCRVIRAMLISGGNPAERSVVGGCVGRPERNMEYRRIREMSSHFWKLNPRAQRISKNTGTVPGAWACRVPSCSKSSRIFKFGLKYSEGGEPHRVSHRKAMDLHKRAPLKSA